MSNIVISFSLKFEQYYPSRIRDRFLFISGLLRVEWAHIDKRVHPFGEVLQYCPCPENIGKPVGLKRVLPSLES
jgi:hypothetical protein